MLYQQQNSIDQYHFDYRRYKNFDFQNHMHRHPELIFIREGLLSVEINGNTTSIPEGHFAFIPSNSIHAFFSPKNAVVDIIVFSELYVPSFFKEIETKQPSTYVFCCRKSILDFVCNELFVIGRKPDFYILKASLYAILGEALNQIVFSDITVKNEILVDRLVHYVSQNFCENITLKSAAEELGYEEHYLSRCFHALIPMHFSRYVNLYRVDAATTLLENTDLPITTIAMQSGFQSIRNFNRVYQEITGKTPKHYR